jgi:hypothetical protein
MRRPDEPVRSQTRRPNLDLDVGVIPDDEKRSREQDYPAERRGDRPPQSSACRIKAHVAPWRGATNPLDEQINQHEGCDAEGKPPSELEAVPRSVGQPRTTGIDRMRLSDCTVQQIQSEGESTVASNNDGTPKNPGLRRVSLFHHFHNRRSGADDPVEHLLLFASAGNQTSLALYGQFTRAAARRPPVLLFNPRRDATPVRARKGVRMILRHNCADSRPSWA